MNNTLTNRSADNIRILSAAMVEKAKSGHPGGAMGGADFINILYTEFLGFDPDDMSWPFRDRFFLDPGHMSPMLYSVLALAGKYSIDDLKSFRQWKSNTPGHPELDIKRGIENTSGPLGQGHAMAVGSAIAERFMVSRFGEWMSHKTYTYISDGGVQEEISQGAGRLAGNLGLSNLIMFYDSNDVQLSTKTEEVTCEDTAAKYRAWGWHVTVIDGNDAGAIRKALEAAQSEKEKPSLIIGKTIMGKGAVTADGKSFEGQVSTHGMPLGEAGASFEKTVLNLNGDPENPFVIFPEVADYYRTVLDKRRKAVAEKKVIRERWEKEHPDLAKKLKGFLEEIVPEIDFSAIVQKEDSATRAASAAVLAHLAQTLDNMIVSSADLSNSDKTDGFLKKTKAFRKGDFSGAFLQAGVSELTMAAITNGIALHGGIIPVCATFLVFSDYMKPAVRLAALMELPVKYIWTHDAFRVGEDGPTHQPVEHEAQLRLMEHLRNHSGERSMLVLRPSDAVETSVAWKMAMENSLTPTALILSRQNIRSIPPQAGKTRYSEAEMATRGAYTVKKSGGVPDIVLIASGSEVSTLFAGGRLLEERNGLDVQIVSVISEGLFRDQDKSYQKETIPPGIPVLGLTAGLPVTLRDLVGPKGMIIGMETFGFSAPYKVLDEKLGFTEENIYRQACAFIGKQPK